MRSWQTLDVIRRRPTPAKSSANVVAREAYFELRGPPSRGCDAGMMASVRDGALSSVRRATATGLAGLGCVGRAGLPAWPKRATESQGMLLGWRLEVEIAAEKFSGPARSRGKGAAAWPSSIVRSPRSGVVGPMDNFKRSACGDGLLRFAARSNFERCASRKTGLGFSTLHQKGGVVRW